MNISHAQLVSIIEMAYNAGLDTSNPCSLEVDELIKDAVVFVESENK